MGKNKKKSCYWKNKYSCYKIKNLIFSPKGWNFKCSCPPYPPCSPCPPCLPCPPFPPWPSYPPFLPCPPCRSCLFCPLVSKMLAENNFFKAKNKFYPFFFCPVQGTTNFKICIENICCEEEFDWLVGFYQKITFFFS